jgi:hypothetical protein
MPVNHTPPAAGTWELAEGAGGQEGIEIRCLDGLENSCLDSL